MNPIFSDDTSCLCGRLDLVLGAETNAGAKALVAEQRMLTRRSRKPRHFLDDIVLY